MRAEQIQSCHPEPPQKGIGLFQPGNSMLLLSNEL
jgi:hypothetical protein